MENYFDLILENPGLNHITIKIFENLDLPALLESMEVSRTWNKFIIENNIFTKMLDSINFPLHNACINGHVKVVKLLLAKGFDGNVKDEHNETPLNYAIQYQNVEIVEILSKQPSINVNARGNRGWIPVMLAATLSMQSQPPKLSLSMKKMSQLKMLQILLQRPDINVNKGDGASGLTALHFSCMSGNQDVVKLLCQHQNIDLNPTNSAGYFPFKRAAEENRIKIVKLFCEQPNFDVNYQYYGGKTGLHKACRNGHTDIVKLLCSHKNINVNVKETHFAGHDNTPLHYACKFGRIEVVRILLQHPNIDVNIKNKKNRDAMALASENEFTDIVELLSNFINDSKKVGFGASCSLL